MSRLEFQGKLHALLCNECRLPLAGSQVLIYRAAGQPGENAAKTSFRELAAGEAQSRSDQLLGQATVDDDGGFHATLEGGEREPLDIVVRVDRLPEAGAELADPVHLHLATVTPDWQQAGDGLEARWQYLIPSRYWCLLLARWGWWVICGRVVDAANKAPLAGLTVTAFDRDWLQDDTLGQALTNGEGRFHIWYQASDFTPTVFSPLINLELTSGPDVYFDVETSGGNKLLDEHPSTGRLPGRENVGHCFCVQLEVKTEGGLPYYDPLFTSVGNFHILSDFNADGTANKSKLGAGGAGWGFFAHPKLRGFCPKVHPVGGQPMHYRFLYVDPVTSAEKPLVGDLLTPVLVGSKLIQWDVNSDGTLDTTFQDIEIAGSGATPPLAPGGSGALPSHVIVPDADGWIAVDQDALDGGFYGPLVRLDSTKVVPGGTAPGSGAGNPPADPKTGTTVTLIFETTTDPSDPTQTVRQSDTVDVRFNNWTEVRQLDLQEFLGGGAGSCTGLTTTVTPKYTVNHEVVAAWSLSMTSAAAPWSAPALPSGTSSVAATHPAIPVAAWPPCSYVVRLSSRRALTDGEDNDSGNTSIVTFCKT